MALLPDGRYGGIYAPPAYRALVDAMAEVVAGLHPPTELTDYANLPEQLLPFVAWQLGAVAFDVGGTEYARRQALHRANELNAAIGTAQAFHILLAINGSTGFLEYAYDADHDVSVTGHMTPPFGRTADIAFLRYMTDRAALLFPFWMAVTAIVLLHRSEGAVHVHGATYAEDFVVVGY